MSSIPNMSKLKSALSIGKDVISDEANALNLLAQNIGTDFQQALEIIFACKGRLVIAGIGKSGHIARKIAATMSSTGTPSLFLHPAEASHGDLGALTKDDVLLALSNSGQSMELADTITYAARHHVKLIAMTKDPKSLLGSHADICLTIPHAPEAGPIGCAPTSSTTMMLALGDALAMALIHLRGFSAEDFRDFHPGGQLGLHLSRVQDIMRKGNDLPIVNPDCLMSEALVIMTQKALGCLLVMQDDALLGVVSDGDLRRHMSPELLGMPVSKIMTQNPTSIAPEFLVSKALGTMNKLAITSLPVTSKNKLVGLVHIHDCLRVSEL